MNERIRSIHALNEHYDCRIYIRSNVLEQAAFYPLDGAIGN